MFSIYDGRSEFYQWDIDRKLIVNDETIKQVHFCNRTDDCSLVCEVYELDGVRVVDVPNILLQTDWRINVYGYDVNYTKHSDCFKVNARTKPTSYVYTETELYNYTIAIEAAREAEQHAENAEAQAEASANSAAEAAQTAETNKEEMVAIAERAEQHAQEAEQAAKRAGETFEVDETLTQSGKAADAKATGDAIGNLIVNEKQGDVILVDDVAKYGTTGITSFMMPKQEGSGEPYPAGGGKNLARADASRTIDIDSGITVITTQNSSEIIVNGTATKNHSMTLFYGIVLPAGTYTVSVPGLLNGDYIIGDIGDGTTYVFLNVTGKSPKTFTLAQQTSIRITVVFKSNEGSTYSNTPVKIQIEAGSTATAYAPYSNIRPISGHNEVQLTRTGKNIWCFEDMTKYLSLNQDVEAVKLETGVRAKSVKKSAGYASTIARWLPISALDGKTITVSVNITPSKTGMIPLFHVGYMNANITKRTSVWYLQKSGILTFTIDSKSTHAEGCEYIGFWFYTNTTTAISCEVGDYVDFTDFQIEIGNAATAYEPYKGETFTVDLEQAAYNGSLNWNSGDFESNMVCLTFTGDENWKGLKQGDITSYAYLILGEYGYVNTKITRLCSHFKHITISSSNQNLGFYVTNSSSYKDARVLFRPDKDTTYEEWITFLKEQYAAGTPVQICFGVSEPYTAQLTPQEVEVFRGAANTIYSNTGDTKITYGRDLMRVIEELQQAIISLGGNI